MQSISEHTANFSWKAHVHFYGIAWRLKQKDGGGTFNCSPPTSDINGCLQPTLLCAAPVRWKRATSRPNTGGGAVYSPRLLAGALPGGCFPGFPLLLIQSKWVLVACHRRGAEQNFCCGICMSACAYQDDESAGSVPTYFVRKETSRYAWRAQIGTTKSSALSPPWPPHSNFNIGHNCEWNAPLFWWFFIVWCFSGCRASTHFTHVSFCVTNACMWGLWLLCITLSDSFLKTAGTHIQDLEIYQTNIHWHGVKAWKTEPQTIIIHKMEHWLRCCGCLLRWGSSLARGPRRGNPDRHASSIVGTILTWH